MRDRKRLPAAERRAQILEVARKLFLAEGIERTSMRGIAAKVGVTPTALYDYFEDKAALLQAIADGFFETMITRLNEAAEGVDEPVERFRRMGAAYVAFGLDHPEEYRLIFLTPTGELRPANMGIRQKGPSGAPLTPGAMAFAHLEGELSALSDAGIIETDDMGALAETVWATVHGIVALRLFHDDIGFGPVEQVLATSLMMVVRGFAPGGFSTPPAPM
ncbi:MAG: TetR family transcriptional regulator [Alphaproteobacteria bacterium]|nr:TetR family transcriptional regulator [Alphaproteobacteria bacterium]